MKIFATLILAAMAALLYKKRTGNFPFNNLFGLFNSNQIKQIELYGRLGLVVTVVIAVSLYYECSGKIIFLKLVMLPIFYLASLGLGKFSENISNPENSYMLKVLPSFMRSVLFVNFLLVISWRPTMADNSEVLVWCIVVPLMTIFDYRSEQGKLKDTAI